MYTNIAIGSIGEKIACGYLGGKGYIILERNFSTSFGEIDIISKSIDKTLVFIEVKTSVLPLFPEHTFPESYPHTYKSFPDAFKPEDRLSPSKIRKFRRIAQFYANQNAFLVKNGYRLDAICIDLFPDLSTSDIRHYEGIS